jgi:hypothetical protein
VVATSTVLQVYGGKYIALLHGNDLIAPQKFYETLVDTITSVSVVASLLMGGQFLTMVVLLQTGVVARMVVNGWLVRKHLPANSSISVPNDAISDVIKLVWKSAWRSGLGGLLAYAAIHGTLLGLSHTYSAQSIASLLLSIRLVFIVSGFANVPFYSRIPKMSSLYASGQSWLRIMFNSILQTMLLYSFGIGVLGVWGSDILQVVGSEVMLLPSGLWFLLGTAFFFERWAALQVQALAVRNTISWHLINGVALVGVLLVFFLLEGWEVSRRIIMAYLMTYAFLVAPFSWVAHSKKSNLSFFEYGLRCSLPSVAVLLGFATLSVYF